MPSSTRRTDWMRVVAELGLPLIVKPAREGSTIGITKVTGVDHGELAVAYAEAARHDDLVLVEEFVAGTELTASILGDRALPLIRIEAPAGNYDYHNKYFSDDTKYFCPCRPRRRRRSGEILARRRSTRSASWAAAAGAGSISCCRPTARSQFLEVNTSPGMTGPFARADGGEGGGTDFGELCVEILRGAHVG